MTYAPRMALSRKDDKHSVFMKVIADLHTHSRFSRACSGQITILSMATAAKEKGLGLICTGDIFHPDWLREAKDNLESEGDGLFKSKNSSNETRFVLGAEVSTIFTSKHKYGARKIHHCILLPSFEAVEALIESLNKYGNFSSDGRPTLMMSAAQLVEELFKAESNAFIFPAHAWTPYFGVLGSISGFDSIKDAYENQEKHIYALETGLSSDPLLNWRVSALDKYTLLSSSDMHSLGNMGRESNIFDLEELSYNSLINAIKGRDKNKFNKTVEFYPEEGKYHYDGHRECQYSVNPETSNIRTCKVCGKPLVIGVLHRVNDLADRPSGFVPQNAIPFIHMVPLAEVIAYSLRKSKYSMAVKSLYSSILSKFGTEFNTLTDASIDDIKGINEEVAQAIDNVRNNRIKITPGYAGVYGKLDLLGREKTNRNTKAINQKSLSDFRT